MTYCLTGRVTICNIMLMDKEIGERLKELRKAGGHSQADMAKLCGVTRPAWTQWETGTRRIPAEMATRLAVKLRVSLDWLYIGIGEPPRA